MDLYSEIGNVGMGNSESGFGSCGVEFVDEFCVCLVEVLNLDGEGSDLFLLVIERLVSKD